MSNPNATRTHVAEDYESAIHGSAAALLQQTGAAHYAGYGEEVKGRVGADLLESSFGCGNPLAFAAIRKGDVVLDLGCGGGLDLILAAEAVGRTGQVIGVDMTTAMVDRARSAVAAARKFNVEVRQGVIEQLPVETDSVDWVISNCVINLSPEKDRVFREIARVLRPGGTMAVSDIVVDRLPWWARRSAALHSACIAGAIGEERFLAGLTGAGLQDAKVTERMHYEASQVGAFLDAYIPQALGRIRVGRASLATFVKRRLVKYAEGSVWSAKFTARKPRTAMRDA